MFAAAVLVAASLPMLREHDDQLIDLLSKAKIAVTGKKKKSDKKIHPPPLTDVDLSNMDDRRNEISAPAHGKRNADLLLDPHYQRAAMTQWMWMKILKRTKQAVVEVFNFVKSKW